MKKFEVSDGSFIYIIRADGLTEGYDELTFVKNGEIVAQFSEWTRWHLIEECPIVEVE